MDDPSLSEHEQRILEEIERNLAAEDPDFVRHVREARPSRDAVRLLRFGILGLLVGLGLLLGYTTHLALGIVGFLVMLAGAVGIGTAVRSLASSGRSPGSVLRDALKRAEGRMRTRRRDP
jgi:hypothetical protein